MLDSGVIMLFQDLIL